MTGLIEGVQRSQTSLFPDRLDDWIESARDVIDAPGPTFVHLSIAPVPGAVGPRSPSPAPPRAAEFGKALQG